MRPVWVVLAAAATSWLPCSPIQGEVVWRHPPDKSIVEGRGALHAVVEVRRESTDELTLSANGVATPPAQKPVSAGDGILLHYYVTLRSGLNSLEIVSGAVHQRREVFFLEPWGEEKSPPDGFTRLVFHRVDAASAVCARCHKLDPAPEDASPASPESSTCHGCHSRITAFKNVHGPASEWACTICHKPDSAPARYETPRPNVSELCFTCHEDLKQYFFASPYQHGPTATGRCTICHNPHASDNPFWLKRAPWYLCTSCHPEKASGRHVIAWGPSGGTHPTRGRPDPMKPDRELACNSCHNPHAAASPKLWNFNVTRHTDLCQTCHQK